MEPQSWEFFMNNRAFHLFQDFPGYQLLSLHHKLPGIHTCQDKKNQRHSHKPGRFHLRLH